MHNPEASLSDFINFMITCPDLQSSDGEPVMLDACATYMSHMHNIRYTKKEWEDIIYPLYAKRFNLVHKGI